MTARLTATPTADRHAERLDRRDRARGAAERHSRRVRRLKVILPSVVGVIVAVIAAMVVVSTYAPGIDLGSLQLGSEGIVMADPRLSGHDGSGRSYEVTADRAVQSLANPKMITMDKIGARVQLGDGSWAVFKAVRGVFDGEREHLTLSDRITIDSSLGYKATLDGAEVDLRGGVVTSAEPFELISDRGTISAGRLEVHEKGGTIVFGGGIKMTLNPGAEVPHNDAIAAEIAKESK